MKRLISLLALLCLPACELTPAPSDAPVTECVSAGVRCQLEPGKLGVCHPAPDKFGAFVCLSQH
jgi:hypothetical protein